MKRLQESRWLVRLRNSSSAQPADAPILLERLRRLAATFSGRLTNLRVTRIALEFDLYLKPEDPPEPYVKVWLIVGECVSLRRLDEEPQFPSPADCVAMAQRYWEEERFWEVHEALEGLWKTLKGRERDLVQGIILGAAAFVHLQKNETEVAPAMFRTALERIGQETQAYFGWDLEKIRGELRGGSIMPRHEMG